MRAIIALAGLLGLALFSTGCTTHVDHVGTWDDGDDDTADDDDTMDPIDEDLHEDVFVQDSPGMVDVLFVVDNSCSMQEEQAALQSNFWDFIQFFVGSSIDYHIGITVLDEWQGQPPIGQLYGSFPYIDPSNPDPVGAFTGNMTMGDDGMGACEVGLDATFQALTEPLLSGHNAGFYRDEAFLLVVIVSDEVDGSTTGCEGITYQEFIPWFTNLKGPDDLELLHFAAIAGDYPGGCSSSWGDADPCHGYRQVLEALGEEHSTFHSICDQDWSPVMTELGLEAAGAQLAFHLSEVPVGGTLTVYVDPDGAGPEVELEAPMDGTYSQPYAYYYDTVENAVVFSVATVPGEGAVIRATYELQD